MTKKSVAVIGGGIAGMETATYLASLGFDTTLIEKSGQLGGKIRNWYKLFPNFSHSIEVFNHLQKGIDLSDVKVKLNTEVVAVDKLNPGFVLHLNNDNETLAADSIVVCTGYDLFDARLKEEYGYGIYDNVITSAELEIMFASEKGITTKSGQRPKKLGFVHCVGSRDEKVGHTYCSKVCCVTGVKQAIEVKEMNPGCEVFNFYMDLRMFGMHFEAMYKKAQEEHSVNFIRGRLSECAETIDGAIKLKVEDTLLGRPMKLSVDLLVLMVGMVPSEGTLEIGNLLGLEFGKNGFLKSRDQHSMANISNVPGVFMAGACINPITISHVFGHAHSAALMVASYLNKLPVENRVTEVV